MSEKEPWIKIGYIESCDSFDVALRFPVDEEDNGPLIFALGPNEICQLATALIMALKDYPAQHELTERQERLFNEKWKDIEVCHLD